MQTIQKILLEFEPEMKNLLPVLKKISAIFEYISQKEAEIIAEYFSVSVAKIFETASFYDLIKTKKSANIVIQICSSANCAVNNSFSIISEIENIFRIKAGDENYAYRQAGNPKIKLETVSCFGRCGEGPIMIVNGKIYERVTKNSAHEILKEYI